MFKKVIVGFTSAMVIFAGANAFACDGPQCEGTNIGKLNVSVKAGGLGIDMDSKTIKNGMAFGISGAGGAAKGGAMGITQNGKISADVDVVAGGVTVTEAYKWKPDLGDNGKGIGVGSSSSSTSALHGSMKLKAKAQKDGFARVGGNMCGVTGQGTLNASRLTTTDKFDSFGHTGGVAAQGSVGGFHGGGFVSAGHGGKAVLKLKAGIDMQGFSYSDSYRGIIKEDGVRTELVGNLVGAETHVQSYEDRLAKDKGCAIALGGVRGGYIAGGGVISRTSQFIVDEGTIGGATAYANGHYAGAGALGTNYDGYAHGGTHTTVSTVAGMNGTITSSSAHMDVGSKITCSRGQRD
jgi:hypothetical protein